MTGPEVLCFGEIVWDSLPGGLFLGGAPLNVARHLCAQGVSVRMASRVGADRLGTEAVDRVAREGVGTDLVQVDPDRPTGFVKVRLDTGSTPDFEIVRPAAWDAIEPTAGLLDCAGRADILVYGTLAQRSATSRATLERLWETGSRKVYDVNLRPPFAPPEIVRRSLEAANAVKLNEQELEWLADRFGWAGHDQDRAVALATMFDCDLVCVTRGENGAALWRSGEWSEHPGFDVAVRDTVGAGDAFLATLLAGLLRGDPDEELLRRANRVAAWVASKDGAVPVGDAVPDYVRI